MGRDYQPKSQNRPGLQDAPYLNEHGQRDVLVGMARAGTNLAKLPLITPENNNYAKAMAAEGPHSDCDYFKDVSADLAELKRIARKYQRRK